MNDIFTRVPVNKQAALVTGQGGCEAERGYLTCDELCELIERLRRQRDAIGAGFVFYTKAHKANFCNQLRRGNLDRRVTSDMAAALEYVRLGGEIQRLQRDLAQWREVRMVAHGLRSAQWSAA